MNFVSSLLNFRTACRTICLFVWIFAVIFNFLPAPSGKAANTKLNEVMAPSANVIYVNHTASGANNGTSWADAFTQMQPALDVASSGDEIWVAQGVYTPTLRIDTGDPRSVAFTLVNDVALYGGFSGVGSETSLDERDYDNYQTILDGDLNGDDNGFENNTENSYHVVVGNSTHTRTTRLDGFVIRGGNADGLGGSTAQGGGLYNDGGNPTFANLIVQSNNAGWGGGFYNRSEIDNQNIGNPLLINVKFFENEAQYGGGMLNLYGEPVLYGVHFLGNYAEVLGGGLRSQYGDPLLVNCIFNHNQADGGGGGIYNSNSNALIENTTFIANLASDGGSGIHNLQSQPVVNNSIFWDNGSDLVIDEPDSATTIHQSLIEGGCPLEEEDSCTGVILSIDPNFRDADGLDGLQGTLDDDLRLKHSSPAIDAGDNSKVSQDTADLDGDSNTTEKIPFDADQRPRFVDIPFATDYGIGSPPVVDLGAYETRVIYVNDNASGSNNGVSWQNAYQSLSTALGQSVYGDDVWVAHGIYKPNTRVDANDARSVTFPVPSGVRMIGDFSGSETNPSQRQIGTPSASILSGDLNGDDNGLINNDENAYSVVTIRHAGVSTVLDGFLIRGGNANETVACPGCNIVHKLTLKQPQIDQTFDSGGGVLSRMSSPSLLNITFLNNFAIQGGGLYSDFGDPYLVNCAWIGNQANFGAGVRNHNSNSVIVNAIFSGNYSNGSGAGMYNTYSSPVATNVIFANNNAFYQGDGVLNDLNSSFGVSNSIFWNNDSQQILNLTEADSTELRYSIIQDGCPIRTNCVNMKQTNPLFIDADGADNQIGTLDDNLQLGTGSPAIDAAENSSVPSDKLDVDGDGNTSEQIPIDLLRYSRFFDMDSVADTGAGFPPIVDMGAYEAQKDRFGYLPLIFNR